MMTVVASPDVRWLAVGGWKELGVRVWDLRRRKLEQRLKPAGAVGGTTYSPSFSPDGRFLISCTSSDTGCRFHFWRTGTWDLSQQIESTGGHFPAVFSGDGTLRALSISSDQVLLDDAASGRNVFQLFTLKSTGPLPLAFSREDTMLAVATVQKTVLLWDLRRVRDQLVPLGLDWQASRYPASDTAVAGTAVSPPLSVRFIGEVIEPHIRRAAERCADGSPARGQPRRCRGLDPPRMAVAHGAEAAPINRRS